MIVNSTFAFNVLTRVTPLGKKILIEQTDTNLFYNIEDRSHLNSKSLFRLSRLYTNKYAHNNS